jgi:hypothetical protein
MSITRQHRCMRGRRIKRILHAWTICLSSLPKGSLLCQPRGRFIAKYRQHQSRRDDQNPMLSSRRKRQRLQRNRNVNLISRLSISSGAAQAFAALPVMIRRDVGG